MKLLKWTFDARRAFTPMPFPTEVPSYYRMDNKEEIYHLGIYPGMIVYTKESLATPFDGKKESLADYLKKRAAEEKKHNVKTKLKEWTVTVKTTPGLCGCCASRKKLILTNEKGEERDLPSLLEPLFTAC